MRFVVHDDARDQWIVACQATIGADPQMSLVIRLDADDAGARQPYRLRLKMYLLRRTRAAEHALEPARRPHPQRSATIDMQRGDAVTAETEWIARLVPIVGQGLTRSIEQNQSSLIGSNPEISVQILCQRRDAHVSQALLRVGLEAQSHQLAAVARDARQTRAGTDPQTALTVAQQTDDLIRRQ